MRRDRDDASISKVVEWFRALALLSLSLSLSIDLSISLFLLSASLYLSLFLLPPCPPSRDRIAVCRGICPWQFGFELFAIFFISFPVISRTSGSRSDRGPMMCRIEFPSRDFREIADICRFLNRPLYIHTSGTYTYTHDA